MRLRSPVVILAISIAVLYVLGIGVVNLQAAAYKLALISVILVYVHFMRKELFPYHDQESCSDARALGMFIFMGLVVVAFMVGL